MGEDEWNPALEDDTILRPHLQEWEPEQKAPDAPRVDELHDPDADDDDERWVNEHLSGGSGQSLSCMGCFTPVCYKSQKHESYEQYRAVEVHQVKVDRNTTLTDDN